MHASWTTAHTNFPALWGILLKAAELLSLFHCPSHGVCMPVVVWGASLTFQLQEIPIHPPPNLVITLQGC